MRPLALVALFTLTACPGGQMMMMGTAPAISSTTPSSMAVGVSPTSALVIEFSAEMDEPSVALTLTPAAQLTATWNEAHTVATFTHAEPFAASTEYTVRVAGKDPAGLALSGNTSFAFTTSGPDDTEPPTLVSSTPAMNAMSVPLNSSLVLVFSEKMDPASLQLTSAPAFDWGSAAWSSNDTTATFSMPTAQLLGTTRYAVSLSASDLAGNPLAAQSVAFTTAAGVDNTAPTVVSTSPPPASSGWSPNLQPSVTFSEPMAASTIAALTLTPDAGCMPTLDSTGTLLTCVHAGMLARSTSYTVVVTAAQARDLANNPLAQDFNFNFTTGAMPDVMPPTLLALTPDGGAGLPLNTRLVATFSEPMDKAATQSAFSLSLPTGKQLFFAWNDGGTALTTIVDGGFAYGQTVTFGVSAAARDLAGNPVVAAGSSTFSVRKLCSDVRLRSVAAEDGYAVDTTTGTSRAHAYRYVSTGSLSRVGRSATALADNSYRGVLVFPFVGAATGCLPDAVSSDALAVTSATLTGTQSAVTGSPYGLIARSGAVDVDWVPFSSTTMDAGVVFTATSPCRALGCSVALSVSATVGSKRAIVTPMVDAALKDRTGMNGKLSLRLRNTYAEGLTTRAADYSDFLDGTAPDGGPTLVLDYEYP